MTGPGMSRRRFLGAATGAAAGVVGLGALSGCAQGEGDLGDGTGEITVWTWPDNDKTFLETIPSFQKKFPDIKVKVQGFGGTYNSKVLGALVSGTGPDVAMIEISAVSNFKSKPGFVDLSKPPFKAGQYSDRYAKFSWSYVTDAETGRIFQLPKNTGPGGMFYRRDVFADAGLPTDPGEVHEAMKTWDDFISVGKKLTQKGKRWLVDSPESVVGAIRAQYGLSYFDEEGNSTFDTDEMVAALEYVPRLRKEGVLAPEMTDQERGAAINAGTIATFFSGNWFGGWLKGTYATTTQGKWGVTFAPETDGVSAFNSGGDFIGVLQSSRNQLAAYEFCRWVTQDPASLSLMYQRDLYPAWTPVLEDSWMNKPDPFYDGQNPNEIFREVSATMKTPITNPNDGIAITALTTAVTDVQNGFRSPKDALRRAKATVESKMG